MSLQFKKVHDGARNTSIQITGSGFHEWTLVVDISKLVPVPREVRVDAVYYMLSDGLEVQLAWHAEEERLPFLPLAGRGRIDFSEVAGLHNNAEGKTGNLELRAIPTGKLLEHAPIFTIVLDLSKHVGV